MRILITGATGFLGASLSRHFCAQAEVHLLVRRDSNRARLQGLEGRVKVHSIGGQADIAEVVRTCRPNVVIHTICNYGRDGQSVLDIFDANVAFGVRLLDALSTEGALPVTFVNVGTSLSRDVNLYALSKAQFSEWGRAQARAKQSRIQFIDVLLQHMYGPGDSRSKFTSHVLHSCRENVPSLALTLGLQRRDLIHISDVVTAFDAIVGHAHELASDETVEVGTGEAPVLRSFVELVHRLTNSKTRLDFGAVDYRANEAMHSVADTARIRALGWTPRYGLEDGIIQTINKEFGL